MSDGRYSAQMMPKAVTIGFCWYLHSAFASLVHPCISMIPNLHDMHHYILSVQWFSSVPRIPRMGGSNCRTRSMVWGWSTDWAMVSSSYLPSFKKTVFCPDYWGTIQTKTLAGFIISTFALPLCPMTQVVATKLQDLVALWEALISVMSGALVPENIFGPWWNFDSGLSLAILATT